MVRLLAWTAMPETLEAEELETRNAAGRPFVLLRPRIYFRVLGFALLFVALVDLASVIAGTPIAQPPGARFDWTHEVLISAIAAAALVAGFGRAAEPSLARAALGFGAAYAILGVAGLLSPTLFGLAPLAGLLLDAPDNVSHVVLGSYGVLVGLAARRRTRAEEGA